MSALGEVEWARAVARHKNFFFSFKGRDGKRVDDLEAVSGRLPPGPRATLEDDYTRMVEAGLLEGSAPSFDEVMNRCERIEQQANGLLARAESYNAPDFRRNPRKGVTVGG